MKKEVNICDRCKEMVSKDKCEICDDDVCDNCLEKETLGIFDGLVCESCSNKLDECEIDEENFWKDFIKNNKNIKEKMMDYIKRNIIIENLSETKKKKDNKLDALTKDYKSNSKLMENYLAKRILKDGRKRRYRGKI